MKSSKFFQTKKRDMSILFPLFDFGILMFFLGVPALAIFLTTLIEGIFCLKKYILLFTGSQCNVVCSSSLRAFLCIFPLIYTVGSLAAVSCFNCPDRVAYPRDCPFITRCGDHEVCCWIYMEYSHK